MDKISVYMINRNFKKLEIDNRWK